MWDRISFTIPDACLVPSFKFHVGEIFWSHVAPFNLNGLEDRHEHLDLLLLGSHYRLNMQFLIPFSAFNCCLAKPDFQICACWCRKWKAAFCPQNGLKCCHNHEVVAAGKPYFRQNKIKPTTWKTKTILVLLQVSHRSWHLGQRSNRTRPQTTFITMIVLNWGMPARTTNHHIALWSYGTPKVKCQACVKPMCNATWLSHVEGAVHHVKCSKKRTRKIHKRNFTEVESSRNGSASGSLARGLCLYLGFNRRLRTKICHARTARHWSSDVANPNDFAKGRSS